MKLDRLSIENFRQYYGVQIIQFSQDSHRNVTVINGQNGAGKTALFTAISWCLYGEAVLKPDQLMSKRAITEARVGESVTARVSIAFVHDSERFLARREVSGVRDTSKVKYNSQSHFSLMHTRRDGQSREVDNKTGTLNAILPETVRTYFFFDGEKIDEFARPDHEDEVKHAVRNVLDIEVLDRAKNHLDAVAREFRTELKTVSTGELQALLEEDESRRQELEGIEGELQVKQNELRSAKKQVEALEQRLLEITAVKEFTERRVILLRDVKQAEQNRDQVRDSLREILNEGPAVLAGSALQKALKILDQKREKGEIPPGIRQQFLQDLLEAMICICGRKIHAGSDEYHRLVDLLDKTFPSDLEDLVLQTAGDVRNVVRRGSQIPEEVKRHLEKKVALDEQIVKLDAQLDEIYRKLSTYDIEEVAELEKKRSEYEFALRQVDMDIHRLKGRGEQINTELDRLSKAIETARKTEAKGHRLAARFRLAQESADGVGKIAEVFAAEMRRRIRERAQTIFQTLVWKTTHFQEIRLTDDYRLDVIDRYGLPARPDLSAGERQVLSLSFIAAMAKVSGKEAPLVMDTPFGRLSGEHRASITKHLPELAAQLILFVTDEELHGEARNNLKDYIGAEYLLDFDLGTSCTTITQVA